MVNIDIEKLQESVIPMEYLKELEVGHIVKGVIAGVFNDFSFVKVGPVSCILPVSEVSYDKKPKSPKAGTEIEAVVIRVSEGQGVMLSIKRAKPDPWESIDEMYHVGQRLDVTVKNIVDYGVFVGFGQGMKGLVHTKDITIQKHKNPKEILSLGEVKPAEIISIDKEKRRIQLSFKSCMDDPWQHVLEKYHIGQKLICKVVKIPDYGAFFEIEPGLEALLHRSEVGLTKKDKMKNYLSVGQELEVEIGTLDVEKKKISLRCEDFSSKLNTQIEGNE